MTQRHRRSVAAALLPTARVAFLWPAAAGMALAGLPAVVALARGADDLSAPLLVASLAAGATLGWATEDPAADTLAALPVGSPVRTWLRLAWVVGVAALGFSLVAGAIAVGHGLPADRVHRAPEAAAAAALAVAVGLTALRRGDRGSAAVGVTVGVLGPLVVAAFAFRWPAVVPGLTPGSAHDRWWVVVAVGLVWAARSGRDPGRR